MGTSAIIGFAVIGAVLVGGLALSYFVSRKARLYRELLYTQGTTLLARGDLSKSERDFIGFALKNSHSFTAAWLVPFVVLVAIAKKLRGTETPPTKPGRDGMAVVGATFIVSVLAANPFAALISAPLIVFLFGVAARQHERPKEALKDAGREMGFVPHRFAH